VLAVAAEFTCVAVGFGILQQAAVFCSVMQCVAGDLVCCSVRQSLEYVTVYGSVMQCVAVGIYIWQCDAV